MNHKHIAGIFGLLLLIPTVAGGSGLLGEEWKADLKADIRSEQTGMRAEMAEMDRKMNRMKQRLDRQNRNMFDEDFPYGDKEPFMKRTHRRTVQEPRTTRSFYDGGVERTDRIHNRHVAYDRSFARSSVSVTQRSGEPARIERSISNSPDAQVRTDVDTRNGVSVSTTHALGP